MKRFLIAMTLLLSLTFSAMAQNNAPKPPDLEFVMELKVNCEAPFSCGMTSHGERVVIPIVGGTFEGPKLKGTILSGGADYQYVDQKNGRNEIEAIYCIKTDDGVNIHIRNCGLIVMGKGDNGAPQFYFRTAPKFDAPNDSKYAWLNNAIFICAPGMGQGYISLNVWMVK